MSKKNESAIGLNQANSRDLAEKLNVLLANYSIFYQNVRGFHWNIKGEKFFELHLKFEELYTDLQMKIDEIAERMLTLGFAPEHRFTRYGKLADIAEVNKTENGMDNVGKVLDSFRIILPQQRELLQLASEAGDEGTGALMSDYIRAQEKMVWMYSAFMGK